LPRAPFVFDPHEWLTGRWHTRQAENLDRHGRSSGGQRSALIVEHRAHPSPLGAGDDNFTLLQRALLHEHGRHWATTTVQPAFDHRAFGGTLWVRLQIEDFRL